MSDFNTLYKANEYEFKKLFRKYRIRQTGIAGIREGQERFGQPFIMKSVDILKQGQNSSFSNYDTPFLPQEENVPDPFDTAKIVQQNKVTSFLDSLLGLGNRAAETITNVRRSVKEDIPNTYTVEAPAKNNFVIVGIGIAVILLIILILKK